MSQNLENIRKKLSRYFKDKNNKFFSQEKSSKIVEALSVEVEKKRLQKIEEAKEPVIKTLEGKE